MSKAENRITKAFIAAPAFIDLSVITEELHKRGVKPITAYQLHPTGISIMNEIEEAISSVDFVIAVISDQFYGNVFFELGLAYAKKKRMMLILSPKIKDVPSDLSGSLYFRAESSNREAIAFALDQLIASQKIKPVRYDKPRQKSHALGDRVDEYLKRLRESRKALRGHDLEEMVVEIFQESGVEAVCRRPTKDLGVDIAVWSDDFQGVLDNPILVEVKSRIRNNNELLKELKQLDMYRNKSGAKWALLLVSSAFTSSALSSIPFVGGVIAITISEFLERLRTRSLVETLRNLRNERVHGGMK